MAEWVSAAASVFVGIVAVGVVFLQRELERRRDGQRVARNSLLAAHHARAALSLIMNLQIDFVDRTRTPLGGRKLPWRFELSVANDLLRLAIKSEIHDPDLLASLIRTRSWTGEAIALLDNHHSQEDALRRLQESTRDREATAAALSEMEQRFIGKRNTHRLPFRNVTAPAASND